MSFLSGNSHVFQYYTTECLILLKMLVKSYKGFSSTAQVELQKKKKADWTKASNFSGHFCRSKQSTFCKGPSNVTYWMLSSGVHLFDQNM